MREILISFLICIFSCSCTQNSKEDSSGEEFSFPNVSLEEALKAVAKKEEFINEVKKEINILKEGGRLGGEIDVIGRGGSSDPDDYSIHSVNMIVTVDNINDRIIKDIEQAVSRSMQTFSVGCADIDYLERGPSHNLFFEIKGVMNDNSDEFRDSVEEGVKLLSEEMNLGGYVDIDMSFVMIENDNDIEDISAHMTVLVDNLDDNIIKDIEQVISKAMKMFGIETVDIDYFIRTSEQSLIFL